MESGRASIQQVKACDPELAADCGRGLRFQVLVADMEVEEPDAVTVISAVLNNQAKVQMQEHEMSRLNRMVNTAVTSTRRSLNHKVDRDWCTAHLEATGLADLVNEQHFDQVLSSRWTWAGSGWTAWGGSTGVA